MQVLVSMYLDTTGSWRMPVPSPRREADLRRISSVARAMVFSLCLLHPHQEGFVFGRPRVGVHCRRREQVGQRAGVIGGASVAPVDGKADLPAFLAVNLERPQTLGHHGHALDQTTRRRDLHLRAVGDALLRGETFGYLDEEARLNLIQEAAVLVLGPV